MKKLRACILASLFFTSLFAEEPFFFADSEEPAEEPDLFAEAGISAGQLIQEESDSYDEDLESLFFTEKDIDVPVLSENDQDSSKNGKKTKPSGSSKTPKAFEATPLTFTGSLASSIGAASIFLDGENDTNTGYFDFYNYIYLLARPDPNFSMRAQFSTKLPMASGSFPITLSSIYFDYLLMDSLYITVGQKTTSWGYPRLFTHNSDQSLSGAAVSGRPLSSRSANNTDILGDSSSGTSVLLRYPLWTGTLSAFALYGGKNSASLKMENVSYAFSCEMLFGKTSVNVFARFNPDKDSDIVTTSENKGEINYEPHCAGVEAKRTLYGFDLYAQWLSDFEHPYYLKDAFSDDDVFLRHLITAGFYRTWDIGVRQFAFNAEYQADNKIFTDKDFKSDTEDEGLHNRMILITGFKKLGPRKNISAGVEWYHDFTDESGYVKPGMSVSGIIPHIDWRTGAKISYGSLAPKGSWSQVTLGTYFKLSFGY